MIESRFGFLFNFPLFVREWYIYLIQRLNWCLRSVWLAQKGKKCKLINTKMSLNSEFGMVSTMTYYTRWRHSRKNKQTTPAHITNLTVNAFQRNAAPRYSISTKSGIIIIDDVRVMAKFMLHDPIHIHLGFLIFGDWLKNTKTVRETRQWKGRPIHRWMLNGSHRKCLHTQTDYSLEEWSLKWIQNMSAMTHIPNTHRERCKAGEPTRHMQGKRPSKETFFKRITLSLSFGH